ncbi:hypothetical protein GE061_007643 [Apolygus lucorum]|uniref:Uncharacterized protein n=1 Tax=Apolygus lucorum TaxID=248454 RepID=A0A6A4IJT5_APOLU|nr:hypothetical protein GE061_007643 [Apolygus lucorum]
MSHFVYTEAGRAPRKIRNGTNDTGYSSLALNGTYEVSGGAALHQITDDGRTRAPRVRGLVPILVIAGASIIFTAASALLLYYNCM